MFQQLISANTYSFQYTDIDDWITAVINASIISHHAKLVLGLNRLTLFVKDFKFNLFGDPKKFQAIQLKSLNFYQDCDN